MSINVPITFTKEEFSKLTNKKLNNDDFQQYKRIITEHYKKAKGSVEYTLKDGISIVNLLSHGNYSLFDPREMVPENKEYFKTILHNFLEDYNFNKKLFEDGQTQEEEE